MNALKFSVLMSVYHKDNPIWFREAVQSVLGQSCPSTEIVLVADGPLTEELEAVINEFKDKLKIVRLEKNMGLGCALNAGLKECSYPLVARMDSDDIAASNRFALQTAAFNEDKELCVLGGAIEEIDSLSKKKLYFRRLPLTDAELKQFLKRRCPFNHMTVMFKKEAVSSASGYLHLHYMEDYYLWVRMAECGFKFANLPQILVYARVDSAFYGRRGGFKYFLSNRKLYSYMKDHNMIGLKDYVYILLVRFAVQAAMPGFLRAWFYKKALRKQ
ncbi:MAG: glycosyltransferase [Elusimicrobia bacterium]|nr:glycosyltransferase [Elusimicrobiota bacterium]